MTIVVLWYRQKFGQLWCAADSRLSSGASTLTDSGTKILPVPVVCRHQESGSRYVTHTHFTLGFAFAGSSLTALNAHAIASACTQNLASGQGYVKPPSVEAVADLFKSVAEHTIRDAAWRLPAPDEAGQRYFFEAMIFGYCRVAKSFKAFAIVPNITSGSFEMMKGELILGDHGYHLMGSGANDFVLLTEEMHMSGVETGVMISLAEMLKRQNRTDVGGHFQIGISDRHGFELRPILNTLPGPLDRRITFLGMDVTSLPKIDNYSVGYAAISPNVL
ncbi:hypothetical protein [Crenobacter cavernae]|uniref:hypothetical protein n=1 Tax=Crenobacter cavernae TaxID=2290923 RepID=UPI00100ECEBB|nr:hypothetical protein [Crenobacter cavernae]